MTDPIRVAWLRSDALPRESIGVTFAPGKKDLYGLSGSWGRDLAEDLRALRDDWKADVLICLVEDFELELLQISELPTLAVKAGLRFVRFPIRDGTAPEYDKALHDTVESAVSDAQAGKRVVVHCRGGLGRAGTFAAYCLVSSGVPPQEAIEAVRAVRRGAIETRAQERSIHEFPSDR